MSILPKMILSSYFAFRYAHSWRSVRNVKLSVENTPSVLLIINGFLCTAKLNMENGDGVFP